MRSRSARILSAMAACLAVLGLVAACRGSSAPGAVRSAHSARSVRGGNPGTLPDLVQAIWAGYQLPSPVTGAAAAGAQGGRLLIAGGTDSAGRPVSSVVQLDPVSGQEHLTGRLREPVSEPAAAVVGGHLMVFGGWTSRSIATVQAAASTAVASRGDAAQVTSPVRPAAQLPQARSGLAAFTMRGITYLAGGTNASGQLASVLQTTDGRHFGVVAMLREPVTEAAMAGIGHDLWVFGGISGGRLTSAIQRVDLRTGMTEVVGRLPRPLAAQTALVLGGGIYLAGGLAGPAGAASSPAAGAGRAGTVATSSAVLRFDPATSTVTPDGMLPLPVAHAAGAVTGGTGYLVGGSDGSRAMPEVVTLRLVPPGQAVPAGIAGATSYGDPRTPSLTPWLGPAHGPGHLAKGSDPAALPADVLVADHLNNRLVIIDPQGRVRWQFPQPGDLAPGQTFKVPDDAFFSPNGRYIIATQEDDQVISVISVARHKIVYRYGKPGRPGFGPNRVSNPDDAMLTPRGDLIAADIRNCRIVLIRPPAHHLLRIIGHGAAFCYHAPPYIFGSPNGAFPMVNGDYLVTEINGDWADAVSPSGHVAWSVNPPGVLYPSDTNEVYPGRYLTADYSDPGQVVEFGVHGKLLWRFGGLNQPSLALPLPNGDILLNDDFNDRIIVIDPATNKIVWQYGHTGTAGRAPGYLNDPDGLDLVPPDSYLIRNAATMGEPRQPGPPHSLFGNSPGWRG